MQNEIWVRLSLTGKDLSPDGKSVFDRPTVDQPKGEGNPDAVTCRSRVPLTATRIRQSQFAALGTTDEVAR